MQILEAEEIKAWDSFTIDQEPISSIDLMERAAIACFHWLLKNNYLNRPFVIFCGNGSNGGDGLAIARLLAKNGVNIRAFLFDNDKNLSPDAEINLNRLKTTTAKLIFLSEQQSIGFIDPQAVIIDALFGTGLNKPVTDFIALVIKELNKKNLEIISIDIPSGLYASKSSGDNVAIRANHTLSFQCFKLAFVMPENEEYNGRVHILDIGLHPAFLQTIDTKHKFISKQTIQYFFKRRKPFAHKGIFGHAALIAGSYGMMGAAVLAARACMRSGVGKLTCHIPVCGNTILQSSLPEAMCIIEPGEHSIRSFANSEKYTAIGIGPGIGTGDAISEVLVYCLKNSKKPLVLDADALNCIGNDLSILTNLPPNTIITPHVKEFERLFGKTGNNFERMELAIQKANALQIIIVLKGRYTLVAIPGSYSYFNSTGNAGMAKAGNGDVLTGMIVSFLAQGYAPGQAALLGVYLHGRAADIAVAAIGEEALLPTDSINCIGAAIKEIYE